MSRVINGIQQRRGRLLRGKIDLPPILLLPQRHLALLALRRAASRSSHGELKPKNRNDEKTNRPSSSSYIIYSRNGEQGHVTSNRESRRLTLNLSSWSLPARRGGRGLLEEGRSEPFTPYREVEKQAIGRKNSPFCGSGNGEWVKMPSVCGRRNPEDGQETGHDAPGVYIGRRRCFAGGTRETG